MDFRLEGPLTVGNSARRWTSKDIIRSRCQRQLITFDMLPDDVLLNISDFYVDEDLEPLERQRIEEWITLAHVCRRWRSVVFHSPRRLNLRLLCTPKSPARDTLDIWPPLPLVIRNVHLTFNDEPSSMDNTIAALECNDRVCQIVLRYLTSLQMEYITDSAAMRKPFLELTDLHLGVAVDRGPGLILREAFLDGTAPRLRSLALFCIPFPGLPKLLLSAPHLVYLSLRDIPPSGYIPPEAMATSLSALTSLESLWLQFRSPRPRPALESRRPLPPPLTRSILPSLTSIQFNGASEYLEEIWARIDAPRLNKMDITFFNQIIFDTPQLFRFISRRSTLGAPEKGLIEFSSEAIIIKFLSQTSAGDYGDYYVVFSLEIRCTVSEWQLSSLEQVCTSSLPPVSTLEDLYISDGRNNPPRWQDDVENTLWLELLHPFAAVKNLYLCSKFIPRIAPALQELVGGRTTEVLPTLENVFLKDFQLSGPLHKGIVKFVAARRLTSHPVAVSRWDRVRRWELCRCDMDSLRANRNENAIQLQKLTNQISQNSRLNGFAGPDYRVLLNNILQGHRTGNLTSHFQYVMTREGPEDNVTHSAMAKFRGVTCSVGRGKSKGIARDAAARVVYEDFLANGVPGT